MFPMELIKQEMSQERWIDIPDEVRESTRSGAPRHCIAASTWRRRSTRRRESTTSTKAPTPRARTSPTPPSLRPTTTSRRASAGWRPKPELASGEARWRWRAASSTWSPSTWSRSATSRSPSALADAALRGEVYASPSEHTNSGRAILLQSPDSPGASESQSQKPSRMPRPTSIPDYCLGSVLNHVLMHQTVIGLEVKKQMEKADDYPDVVSPASAAAATSAASPTRSSATSSPGRLRTCEPSRSSPRPARR